MEGLPGPAGGAGQSAGVEPGCGRVEANSANTDVASGSARCTIALLAIMQVYRHRANGSGALCLCDAACRTGRLPCAAAPTRRSGTRSTARAQRRQWRLGTTRRLRHSLARWGWEEVDCIALLYNVCTLLRSSRQLSRQRQKDICGGTGTVGASNVPSVLKRR